MFVKLVHNDSVPGETPEFTLFANVSRVEFTRVKQTDRDTIEFAQIWCFGDPVTGFITYNLAGDPNNGDHPINSVFVLNDEGKTIERFFPAA